MKFPYNTEDGKSAPAPDKGAPASIDQVLSKRPLRIGGPEDLTPKERELIYRNMPKEPVPGEKTKPRKYAKGGSIDGCAIKGKTRGKIV